MCAYIISFYGLREWIVLFFFFENLWRSNYFFFFLILIAWRRSIMIFCRSLAILLLIIKRSKRTVVIAWPRVSELVWGWIRRNFRAGNITCWSFWFHIRVLLNWLLSRSGDFDVCFWPFVCSPFLLVVGGNWILFWFGWNTQVLFCFCASDFLDLDRFYCKNKKRKGVGGRGSRGGGEGRQKKNTHTQK